MSAEAAVTLGLAILSVFLYFIGFNYLQGYYSFYYINMFEIEMGLESILAHSFIVFHDLMSSWIFIAPAILIILPSPFFWGSIPSLGLTNYEVVGKIASLCGAIIILALLVSLFRADGIGKKNAEIDSPNLPAAFLYDGSMRLMQSKHLSRSGDIRFVASTRSDSVFVSMKRNPSTNAVTEVFTFRLPKDSGTTIMARKYKWQPKK